MICLHLACLLGEGKMLISDLTRDAGLSRTKIMLLNKENFQRVVLGTLDKLCKLFSIDIHYHTEQIAIRIRV